MATDALDFESHAPDAVAAFVAAGTKLERLGLDPRLVHLVKLRASQMNQCVHCMEMHLREARASGETQERLDYLAVWGLVSVFTPGEKSALAWVEALTRLPAPVTLTPLRKALREHFGDAQIVALTMFSALINLWNRIAISSH